MRRIIFLGLDTSCYTTSLAAADKDENILVNIKKQLAVEKGGKGLRQSDGVFLHIKNLPVLFCEAKNYLRNIRCIAASASPRPAEGSYMPVFTVGKSYAEALSHALDAKLVLTTHQHAHLYAAMIGNNIKDGRYLAAHASGGTTEILETEVINGFISEIRLLGGTKDITAGQLIDRTGVMIGLNFPCGGEMEKLAYSLSAAKERLPVTVNGVFCNLSGAEAAACRLINGGADKNAIARMVFECAGETFVRLLKNAGLQTGVKGVILSGGVFSGKFIKEYVVCRLNGYNTICAKSGCSADNAAGLAILAKRKYFAEDVCG